MNGMTLRDGNGVSSLYETGYGGAIYAKFGGKSDIEFDGYQK